MALGWNVSINESICAVAGQEHHILKVALTKRHSPMLLIIGYPDAPEVMIILPGEETLRACPLKEFKSDQVIRLNARLPECLKSESYSSQSLSPAFLNALREQLKL